MAKLAMLKHSLLVRRESWSTFVPCIRNFCRANTSLGDCLKFTQTELCLRNSLKVHRESINAVSKCCYSDYIPSIERSFLRSDRTKKSISQSTAAVVVPKDLFLQSERSTILRRRHRVMLSQRCLHTCATLRSTQWCSGDPLGDPNVDLDALLVGPLFEDRGALFQATKEQMKAADVVFRARRRLESVLRVVDEPPEFTGPEVCFIGRSNVGKSSLIKSLFFDPDGVKIAVSKTPGRTRALNFYRVDGRLTLVDVPGYGYNMPEHYTRSVESYIRTRNNLVRTFLLVDAAAGLTHTDKIGVDMMQEFGRPYVVVLTKIDKATHHKVLRVLLDIHKYREDHMSGAFPQIFLLSSRQNVGVSMLRAFIAHLCGITVDTWGRVTQG